MNFSLNESERDVVGLCRDSRKVLADALADVPDDDARRIAETNARQLYRFPAP